MIKWLLFLVVSKMYVVKAVHRVCNHCFLNLPARLLTRKSFRKKLKNKLISTDLLFIIPSNKFWLFLKRTGGAVVVVEICPPITGQRHTLTIGRSTHFSFQ